MKYTKAHEAAHIEFHRILLQFFRGRITAMELNKAIFKAVANHRYSDAWVMMATTAMNAKSVADYEAKVTDLFTVIVTE